MKFLLLAFFVAVGAATPIPMDDAPLGDAVEVVVNGLAEGEPLDIGHLVDVKVQDIVDGEVAVVANALHPFTAQGLAEAAAAAAEVAPEPVVTKPDVIPEVIPALLLPELLTPEVSEPVVIPGPVAPEVVPEPIVLPGPATPEVVPTPELIPTPEIVPAPINPAPEVAPEPAEEVPETAEAPSKPDGEIFNNGVVAITVNTPEDAGVIATLSSWVSMMVNYVNSGIAYTQQLI